MKALIEENDEASSKRYDIHESKKPALVKTLQELDRSYNSFAKEIYHSRSKSPPSPPIQSSSPYSVGENLHLGERKLVAASHDPDIEGSEDGPGSVVDDLTSTENCDLECLADEAIPDMTVSDKDFATKLYFLKLVEENLRQKEELIRRNEEKRATINMLRLQLECLKGENQALHECLGHSPAHFNSSPSRIIKGLFKRGCSS